MDIVDANVVLRYLLRDSQELADKAREIIENKIIEIPFEVIAEVVYVLKGVYEVPKYEIKTSLVKLLKYPNVIVNDFDTLIYSLELFENNNLDFVDCILIGYNKIRNITVHTFDKKIKKIIDSKE